MNKNLITDLFITGMLVVAFTGWDVAHSKNMSIKAANVPSVSPTATLAPTPAPIPPCVTFTPYDTLIEKYFKDSCNVKRILRWVSTDGKLYGENAQFITADADRQNHDLSWDRGLMRINSNTFAGYLKRMPKLMHENGLYEWNDMLDVEKNIRMASIIYTYQGYCAWYAAPNDLCSNNYPGIKSQ